MGRDYEAETGKVIKPPLETMAGKTFKPAPAFRNKLWFTVLFVTFIIWVMIIATFYFASSLVSWLGYNYSLEQFLGLWLVQITYWYWIISLFWIVPLLIFIPIYIDRIEYSVRAESGESLPEIYVKKGLIDITEKHVPFRAITNLTNRTGPFDRLFGIGNIEIETAGYSGSMQTGPEEKIEGILFHDELRDYMLQEIRKFKAPYATTMETEEDFEETESKGSRFETSEIILVLQDIKAVLEKIDSKLDSYNDFQSDIRDIKEELRRK
ncbi:MAG: PH domain-containing protein [Candidatus Lokiarchaeota archaeon]|nr:PH domain-containing protein [Candidatus Lokiarchaeota archaeon]